MRVLHLLPLLPLQNWNFDLFKKNYQKHKIYEKILNIYLYKKQKVIMNLSYVTSACWDRFMLRLVSPVARQGNCCITENLYVAVDQNSLLSRRITIMQLPRHTVASKISIIRILTPNRNRTHNLSIVVHTLHVGCKFDKRSYLFFLYKPS